MRFVLLSLIVLLALMPSAAWAGLFSDDVFVSIAECTYEDHKDHDKEKKANWTRTQAWQCLTSLGDTNHDDVLTKKEINKIRSDHLTRWERFVGPSSQSIIDRCHEHHGKKSISKATFIGSTKAKCAGNQKDICRIHGICLRELDTKKK